MKVNFSFGIWMKLGDPLTGYMPNSILDLSRNFPLISV